MSWIYKKMMCSKKLCSDKHNYYSVINTCKKRAQVTLNLLLVKHYNFALYL